MNYKIIGKYIKELNFKIPNTKAFYLLSKDIVNYKTNGCSHFSVSTLLFHPYKFGKFYLNHINKNTRV